MYPRNSGAESKLMHHLRTPPKSLGMLGICFGFWLAFDPAPSLAYTPEDPVVNQMVERGIGFLEAVQAGKFEDATRTYREGGTLLAAYTHHKVRQDATNPVVQEGLKMALADARKAMQGRLSNSSKVTYEASVALLLMMDVDPTKYAGEIQGLGDALFAAQKSNGGFGYLSEEEGDTSQTQYVVLAMWTMDQANFKVPTEVMARAVHYLLRTQDPTGQWGYKGIDSNSIGKLVPQDERKGHALTTAGAGSVLIGGDYFGLWRKTKQLKNDVKGLPPALKEQAPAPVIEEKRAGFSIPAAGLMQFVERTDNWLTANPYRRPQGPTWFYYYLYTLERYESFLEIARGRQEKEPDWYNAGVEALRSYQSSDGGWAHKPTDSAHSSAQIATSFSILFLIRSTQKAIGELSEGMLAGGYELPKDTTNIRVEGTQIKGKPVATAVTDLLSLLEDEDPDSLETGSIPEDLKLAEDPAQRKQQLSRLERLARGSESYTARRVAVRLLAESDELKAVPTLVYALSDPDPVVKRYARDGLRFISRRFDGFGTPDAPSPREAEQAAKAWRKWYNELDPGYVFLD